MSARWSTLGVWALVMASAVYWGLKLWVQPMAVPGHATVAMLDAGNRGELSRVLGTGTPTAQPQSAQVAPPVEDTRLSLLGVLNPLSAHAAKEGVALIAIDGQPARAFRIGAPVDGDRVLQSVGPRSASLGPRGAAATVTLELPALPEAARGVPGAGAAPAQAPGQQAPPEPSQLPSQEQPPAFRPPPQPFAPQSTAPQSMPTTRMPVTPGVRPPPFSNPQFPNPQFPNPQFPNPSFPNRMPGNNPNQVPPTSFQTGPSEMNPVAGRQTETMR
jgi:general secretion pathway protein C